MTSSNTKYKRRTDEDEDEEDEDDDDDNDSSMPGLQERIDFDCDTCSTSEAMVSQYINCIVIIIITTICIYDIHHLLS